MIHLVNEWYEQNAHCLCAVNDDLSERSEGNENIINGNHLPNYVANFLTIPGFIARRKQCHVPH